MTQLLIIADDLTGALDSGVHFATKGIQTVVKVSKEYEPTSDADVIIIDSETRHVDPKLAYEIVFNLVRAARKQGVSYFLKKTDSVLRGRIGEEILAMSDASNETIHFIPAYPSQGRTTKNGIQYVDGIAVHNSIFGKDPFAPVTGETIKEILNIKSIPIFVMGHPQSDCSKTRSIIVYDAENDKEVEGILQALHEGDSLHFLAGCAGLAQVLAEILPFEKNKVSYHTDASDIFVVCGSLNPISKSQIEFACQHGFTRLQLPKGAKFVKNFLETEAGEEFLFLLSQSCANHSPIIVDVFDEEPCCNNIQDEDATIINEGRELVAGVLGALLQKWIQMGINQIPVVIGGDTLDGFLGSVNYNELRPICELSAGVVLSELVLADRKIALVSKSGGLGHLETLVDIRNKLTRIHD